MTRSAIAAVAAAVLAAGPASAVSAKVRAECEDAIRRLTPDNAAYHYWKAIAALPETEEKDQGYDGFVKYTLIKLPPAAIDEWPGVRKEIQRYAKAVTVHLRNGARLERCDFDIDWGKGIGATWPLVGKMGDLAKWAAAYGMLLEADGRPREAAAAYLDILRTGCHSGVATRAGSASLWTLSRAVRVAGGRLEGLFARVPDAHTARFVLQRLSALPERPLDVSAAADRERSVRVGWQREVLFKAANRGQQHFQEVVGSYGKMPGERAGPHEPWHIPDDPAEVTRQIEAALAVLDGQLQEIVDTIDGPYRETRASLAGLAEKHDAYWAERWSNGDFAAALLCGTREMLRRYPAIAAGAGARLAGLKLLAAAAVEKAETGRYPASLAGLKRRFPAGLPKDPFTGRDFAYWLHEDMPCVVWEADNRDMKEVKPEAYTLSLSHRLALENWELERCRVESARPAAPRRDDGPR